MNHPIETDALIIGAGPVGIFQAFQLGLLEVNAHIVDALPYPGGQCIELYPDKLIYDIPGTPRCTGRELVANLLEQLAPFSPKFHLGQLINNLQRRSDGRLDVGTSAGTNFIARTVIVAAGVGAFQPKLLRLDGLEQFEGKQLFYQLNQPEQFAAQHLVIVGGEDAALHWAAYFAKLGPDRAASVTLIHRRDVLRGAPDVLADIEALRACGALQFKVGQATGFTAQDDCLVSVQITGVDGNSETVPLDALLVFQGLSPKLGPLMDWGLAIERKQVQVDTEKFATSLPGIFAVGDVNVYPGKKKLILSGFHECALAAFGVAATIFPDKKIPLQYTTTSTRLHQLLGVSAA
ncbi:MAG: NAD(P)/FAD-dependent oxidoreductase [Polaromonas sp.]|nr:NAD(P)/FAD-dependent oxidoreductase [Polaromonas sp.]